LATIRCARGTPGPTRPRARSTLGNPTSVPLRAPACHNARRPFPSSRVSGAAGWGASQKTRPQVIEMARRRMPTGFPASRVRLRVGDQSETRGTLSASLRLDRFARSPPPSQPGSQGTSKGAMPLPSSIPAGKDARFLRPRVRKPVRGSRNDRVNPSAEPCSPLPYVTVVSGSFQCRLGNETGCSPGNMVLRSRTRRPGTWRRACL